jgi:hypothetical protein
MNPDHFELLKSCRARILAVLGEGEMTRTRLVRRCTAHDPAVIREALGMLLEGGGVSMRLEGHGRRATSMLQIAEPTREARDPLLVRLSAEAIEAQGEAEGRVRAWLADLGREGSRADAAREMLASLHRAPWKYAAERPLSDIADGLAGMKAARKLASMGAIVLKERRGRGRASTFRLAHVPPYPMK